MFLFVSADKKEEEQEPGRFNLSLLHGRGGYMDIGTTAQISVPQHRTTTAVGDRDVGQKGSFYRRQRRDKQQSEEEELPEARSKNKKSQHTIDIRV